MQINKFIGFILLTLSPVLASAAIYKWVDEHGNVQFSSQKPLDAEAEKVRVSTQPLLSPGESRAKAETDTETAGGQKPAETKPGEAAKDAPMTPAEKRAEARKKAESNKMKKEMCDEARKALATLQNNARVRVEDAAGNLRYMDEGEMTKRKQAEQERVKKYCN